MTREKLFQNILAKKSFLCIGLDTDREKIPSHLGSSVESCFEFNKQIIDATHEYAVAYKLNSAFYESQGAMGWEIMKRTMDYIPENIFVIADAKRGDIGNTSSMYAKAFFEQLPADAITVVPYMGEDSVKPFLNFKDKWVILLALTSNPGSNDFQFLENKGSKLFETVIKKSVTWGNAGNMMYVVGATHPADFISIRKIIPDHFLLVPGTGSQGGDLHAVAANGMNKQCGLLVNSSRQIIYASAQKDFAEAARKEAKKMQSEMHQLLSGLF